jgi:glucosyl-3-phosphoglycerate synthase
MADFYQNGIVTTMHNLEQRDNLDLEAELKIFSETRPMGLILPSLFSELEGEALPAIVDNLCEVPYLTEIVIGLDRANEAQYRHALKFFKKLPQHHRVLWNEGPRLKALDAKLQKLGVAPKELGKGRNVWYCMG